MYEFMKFELVFLLVALAFVVVPPAISLVVL